MLTRKTVEPSFLLFAFRKHPTTVLFHSLISKKTFSPTINLEIKTISVQPNSLFVAAK